MNRVPSKRLGGQGARQRKCNRRADSMRRQPHMGATARGAEGQSVCRGSKGRGQLRTGQAGTGRRALCCACMLSAGDLADR
jgi:hypothetical protein